MSSSDSDSEGMLGGYTPRKRFPLHDAAERGDLETMRRLLAIKPTAAEEGEEGEVAGDGGEEMDVDLGAVNGEGAAGSNEEEEEEEEEEESEVASEDDESYQASGQEDEEGEDEEDEEDEGALVPQPVDVNEKDNFGCTALHVAIHARQLDAAKLLLENGASLTKKTEGSTPLHVALAVGSLAPHRAFALEAVRLLVERGADVNAKDDCLHTPLHLAATHGLGECAALLLEKGALESMDIKDRFGNRPLHLAAKAGHAAALQAILPHIPEVVKGEESTSLSPLKAPNLRGETPLHLACRGGHWAAAAALLGKDGNGLGKLKDKRGATPGQVAERAGFGAASVPAELAGAVVAPLGLGKGGVEEAGEGTRTLLVQDPTGLEHRTCTPIVRAAHIDPPPENVNRLRVLIDAEAGGILHAAEFDPQARTEWMVGAPKAELGDLMRVHDFDYLRRIEAVCARLPPGPYAIGHLDGDTAVSRESWEAALRAAGAACAAVDRVLQGKNRNAFCVVRPPGHHAGSRGVVKCDPTDQGSHGFCLINNVAVAASYARHVYRHRGVKRVAIVDFDVHHGNGTEEIIENLAPHKEEVRLSGPDHFPWGEATFRATKYKPWLNERDAEEVLFVSVHGYGGRDLGGHGAFYPGSGRTRVPEVPGDGETTSEDEDAAEAAEAAAVEEAERAKAPLVLDVGMGLVDHSETVPGTSRVEWRKEMRETVLPRLAKFRPDLVLISAGFDAHRKDSINMGYLGLVEEDYEWVTRHLVRIANTHCGGRVVSVLEGGYKIQGGLVSAFARSVASHVRALVEGCRHREGYDAEELAWEQALEQRQHDAKVRKMEERLQEQAERVRLMMAAKEAEEAAEAAAASGDAPAAAASASAAAAEAAEAPVEEEGGGRRKRRAASKPVDYVALAKQMKEEEQAAKRAKAAGAE